MKRITALLLVLSLAACGGSEAPAATQAPAANAPAAAASVWNGRKWSQVIGSPAI